MLTIHNIKSSVITIESVRTQNHPNGCDSETFVCDYLVDVLGFHREQIHNLNDPSSYADHLQNKTITALFLESPYEKAFFKKHCQGYVYVNTPLPYRFGGFGFVFQKNSSLADTFSEAILKLSENGNLSDLQHNEFASGCVTDGDNTTTTLDPTTPSLGFGSFWVLYVVSISTSTCCLAVAFLFFRRKHGNIRNESRDIMRSPTVEMNRSRELFYKQMLWFHF
ncbi:hypothetical protein MLD38_037764 [Melastoma candidum]|nr:hypothetical protein MLD38_037764 [Melastoma candidum]